MGLHSFSLRYRWIVVMAASVVLSVCSGNIVFCYNDAVYDRFSVGSAQRC